MHDELPGARGQGAQRGVRHPPRRHDHRARLHRRPDAARRAAQGLPSRPQRRINLVPTSTGAAKAIGLVIPELLGRLQGFAVRVPLPTGSLVDLTVELEHETSAQAVNDAIASAPTRASSKGILAYSEEPLVSTDIVQSSYSSVFDAGLTIVTGGTQVKVSPGTTTSGATPAASSTSRSGCSCRSRACLSRPISRRPSRGCPRCRASRARPRGGPCRARRRPRGSFLLDHARSDVGQGLVGTGEEDLARRGVGRGPARDVGRAVRTSRSVTTAHGRASVAPSAVSEHDDRVDVLGRHPLGHGHHRGVRSQVKTPGRIASPTRA